VGYEIFPGNTYEGNTLLPAINKLKEKYLITEAIIVADSGLLSKENIDVIKKSGYQYILGARLKNLPQKWRQAIVENEEWDNHPVYYKDDKDDKNNEKEKTILKTKSYDYPFDRDANEKPERLIISHSSARAAKDKYDRQKALDKLLAKLKNKTTPTDLISNYGYKKYLKIEGDTSVVIDEDKLAKEALWDGLHGIFTNTEHLEINDYAAYNHYNGLWQVEDSFRIDKHDLRMRPVFHWTTDRIHAHIAICFVAFSLIRFLQHHIKQEEKVNYSARRISIELNSVQQSILYDIHNKNNRYVIPSKSNNDVLTIYNSMKLHRTAVPYKLLE
jgi:transposase